MFEMHPVGHVLNSRNEQEEDCLSDNEACIRLVSQMGPDALDGIEEFSHALIIYYLDRVDPQRITRGSRHPLGNPAWPRVGIFAQYGANRPNRIATALVRILRHEGTRLYVSGLDTHPHTAVLDIKPVMQGVLPQEGFRQPDWAGELLACGAGRQRLRPPAAERETSGSRPDGLA